MMIVEQATIRRRLTESKRPMSNVLSNPSKFRDPCAIFDISTISLSPSPPFCLYPSPPLEGIWRGFCLLERDH